MCVFYILVFYNLLYSKLVANGEKEDLNSSISDLDCSGLVDTDSNDASTQPSSFDRLAVDSPSTSVSKTTTSDTQALINETILQQLTAISDRLNKIEQQPVNKTSKTHTFKSRSAGTKNNKVIDKSDSTYTSIHSSRMHTNVTDIHAKANDSRHKAIDDRISELQIPSTVSLPAPDHFKANDIIKNVIAKHCQTVQITMQER